MDTSGAEDEAPAAAAAAASAGASEEEPSAEDFGGAAEGQQQQAAAAAAEGEQQEQEAEGAEGEGDGEGEWITPDNVTAVSARLRGRLRATREAVAVGCMTTDFACQNVLMQLGVPVISADGMHIRKARQWMLKCFSCLHTTRDPRKLFCPSCGNDTLRRVALEMSESGELHEVTGSGPLRNVRGSTALPRPRGGRHNTDPIRSEDVLQQRLRGLHRPRGEDSEEFGVVAPRELLARHNRARRGGPARKKK
eukprot:m51a1_g6094 hypothetical protein (251) ;mRNA; f:44289-45041